MELLIPTIGTRGDVQPFIALALGLHQAGHNVTLASHPMMKPLVESYQVTFAPIGPDIDLAEEVARIRQGARTPVTGLMQGMQFGFRMLEQSHHDILALCQECDLVVVPTAVAAGKNEAELSGLPYLSVSLMPWAVPYDDPQRPLHKRVAYSVMDSLVNRITIQPLNKIRRKQGLPPAGREGFTSPILNLIPVSPAVYPPNPLWEDRHKLVGYWFTETPIDWEPQTDLLAFLEQGDPPVVISLGAMSLGEGAAQDTVRLLVEAVQQTGTRAIIQGWQSVTAAMDLPGGIFAAGPIPHNWLLPRCSGVIHHGGFGTTAAGLRAGIPTLVIPHVIDQFYWGQRIYELGVGPKPIRRTDLDAKKLVGAITSLVQDNELKNNATRLGNKVRSEKGLENAVRIIEDTFALLV